MPHVAHPYSVMMFDRTALRHFLWINVSLESTIKSMIVGVLKTKYFLSFDVMTVVGTNNCLFNISWNFCFEEIQQNKV